MTPFLLVAGPPGSGKTTYVTTLLAQGTVTDHLYAGDEWAALPPDSPIGTRIQTEHGTLTAVGDWERNSNDIFMAGADIFYRLNNSKRTPWPNFTRMKLIDAVIKVTERLPADAYIYDSWDAKKTFLLTLKERFDLSVLLLQCPPDICADRRHQRILKRRNRNPHFEKNRPRLADPTLTPQLTAKFYQDLSIPTQTLSTYEEVQVKH